jgi:hypothetical protein
LLRDPTDTAAASPCPALGGRVLRGHARAELQVRSQCSELLLQSREIEDQTQVTYLHRRVRLWEALKSVAETCFTLWGQLNPTRAETFVPEALAVKERCAKEGQDLVLSALRNPLQAKATARVLLLGHNFLRTLDICLEALLRFPSQKEVTPKPELTEVLIDWAVGGIRDWAVHYPYAFEQAGPGGRAPQRMAHVSRHYSTDRNARSQISHKQIANIFLLRETTVAELERRGLAKLRAAFEAGRGGDFDLSELT